MAKKSQVYFKFSVFFSLLLGMDAQQRQVSQEVTYEIEWRSAFTLHMELAPTLGLMLQWCSKDRVVFIKAVRMLFRVSGRFLSTLFHLE